jgi:Domain of unknown function (DUF4303)
MATEQQIKALAQAIVYDFRELCAINASEKFCAFALYSDDEGWTVIPSANSEEGIERSVALYNGEVSAAEIRISTAEWVYEAHLSVEIDKAVARLLLRDKDFSTDKEQSQAVGQLWATMFLALRESSNEIRFIANNPDLLLMCSVSDSDEEMWLMHETSRLLNTPEIHAAAFSVWPYEAKQELVPKLARPSLMLKSFRQQLLRHGVTLD